MCIRHVVSIWHAVAKLLAMKKKARVRLSDVRVYIACPQRCMCVQKERRSLLGPRELAPALAGSAASASTLLGEIYSGCGDLLTLDNTAASHCVTDDGPRLMPKLMPVSK